PQAGPSFYSGMLHLRYGYSRQLKYVIHVRLANNYHTHLNPYWNQKYLQIRYKNHRSPFESNRQQHPKGSPDYPPKTSRDLSMARDHHRNMTPPRKEQKSLNLNRYNQFYFSSL